MNTKVLKLLISRLPKNATVSFSKQERYFLNNKEYFYSICQLALLDKATNGFGVDQSQEVAKIKSLMEAVERSAVVEASVKCNGVAAHLLAFNAKRNAYYEALERDSCIKFLMGLYTPIDRVNVDEASNILLPSADSAVVVSLSFKKNKNCITFGLGASRKQEEAIQKSQNELVLSEVRHVEHNCSHTNKVYEQLHANTRSDYFKNLLSLPVERNGNVKHVPQEKLKYRFESVYGMQLWPTKVIACYTNDLFLWDLQWLKTPNNFPEHQNSRLVKIYNLDLSNLLFCVG